MLTPSLITILTAVSAETSISREDIIGRAQSREVVLARHMAMWLLWKLKHWTPARIAMMIGDRDRGCAIYALNRIGSRCEADPDFLHVMNRLAVSCEHAENGSMADLEAKIAAVRDRSQQLLHATAQLVDEAEALRPLARRKV